MTGVAVTCRATGARGTAIYAWMDESRVDIMWVSVRWSNGKQSAVTAESLIY